MIGKKHWIIMLSVGLLIVGIAALENQPRLVLEKFAPYYLSSRDSWGKRVETLSEEKIYTSLINQTGGENFQEWTHHPVSGELLHYTEIRERHQNMLRQILWLGGDPGNRPLLSQHLMNKAVWKAKTAITSTGFGR